MNDTICQLRIPQNRCSGPKNGIFHDSALLDATISVDPAIVDGPVDLRGGVDFWSHFKAGFTVGLARSEIEPPRFAFDEVGAELIALDQFQKGRDYGDFLSGGNEIENFRVNTIDSRELMGSGQFGDFAVNVGDSAALDGEVESGSVGLHRERGGIIRAHVARDKAVNWEVGDDVAIVYENWVTIDPRFDVFDAAAGFEEDGLMEEGQGGSAVGSVGKSHIPGFGEMVGVDRKIGDARRDAVIHHMCDQGPVGEGDEGLWQGVGEGLQASPQSGSE